jgi:CheY-like chemotaxis protein
MLPADSTMTSSLGPKLLLCDDSPIERLALAHYLRAAGYNVDEAADGCSAVQYLKNSQVDLLLLDLEMPDVDGFDVLNYVQEHRRALPVILLSGMAPDEIQGKMDHLHTPELPPLFMKPIDPQQLIELVEMQLTGQISMNPEQDIPDARDARDALDSGDATDDLM